MPLSDAVRQLVGTAQFWSDYFGDEAFGSPVRLGTPHFLEFPLTQHYSLRAGFGSTCDDDTFIRATHLILRHTPSGKENILGWRWDDGRVHPHVLRWEEVHLIGRLQALKDPQLPHPGVPFLLLVPYVASIEGTDHLLGLRILDAALHSLGVFNERQIHYRLADFGPKPATSAWRRIDQRGWICQYIGDAEGAKWIHSLRDGCHEFPFGAWNDCMKEAERELAESQEVPTRNTALSLPALSGSIRLHLQLENDEGPIRIPSLCQALFEEGLGVCYWSGGCSPFDDALLGEEYIIAGYGELAEFIELIRRAIPLPQANLRLFQLLPPGSEPRYRRIQV